MGFKYCSVANALLVVLAILTTVPSVAQRVSVKIDADNIGRSVSSDMFGGNFVFTFTNFVDYEKSLSTYRQTCVRYPGGGVAENEFNVNNPFVRKDGSSVLRRQNISTFIAMVNKYNWRAIFVLPTVDYINNVQLAELEIERYVRNILTGAYGLIEHGRTVHFEIGNEFYFRDDITAAEYGFIASKIVDVVHLGIANANRGSTYRYEVSVQSGITVDDAKTVAPYFKDQQSKIDFLTFHWYPGRTEIQLGLWGNQGTTQTFSDRLNDISNTWRNYAYFDKPYFLSEYNIRGERSVDYGLRNPMGIMSIFAESIRANTRIATNWPVIGRGENLPAKLFRADSGGVVTATTNGIFMGWLRDTLPGSHIIRSLDNPSYSNTSNFRRGIYVEAFRKGHDTMIVYVFGMEGPTQFVHLQFENFKIKSRRAEKLYTAPGSEANPNVVAKSIRIWPKVWGRRKNNATITINRDSKYEVAKIVLKGEFL